jgi:hypothetical protein
MANEDALHAALSLLATTTVKFAVVPGATELDGPVTVNDGFARLQVAEV